MTNTNISNATTADQDFTSVTTIAAGPERVLAALTTTEGVAGWWGTTSGSAGAVGDVLEVGFGTSRVITMDVASLEPGRVEWFVKRAPFTPEWDGTSIVFELGPSDDGTELHFRHVGLTPRFECYEMCHAGWTHYLASLAAYAEHGVGDPYRED
jgi:uncharacterized protein YndB with AHSA1/START domain